MRGDIDWQKVADWILKTVDCRDCNGFGKAISKRHKDRKSAPLVNCRRCRGKGRVTKARARRKQI